MMRSSVNRVSQIPVKAASELLTWRINVSEGGLGHRPWCCITDLVMYHQSRLTRHGRPGPHSAGDTRRQYRPAGRSGLVTCGNEEFGERGSGHTQGRTVAVASLRLITREAR